MARILIVDDDADFASAVSVVLRQDGHEVRTLTDTRNVIEKVKAEPPDLLILDVMFPDNFSAGFELAREIRQAGKHLEALPILMLTAINTRFPLDFSKNDIDEDWLPVTDFLEKTEDFDILQRRVTALLKKIPPAQQAGK